MIRSIGIFDKKTENLVKEIDVTHISLSVWQSILTPYKDDPEMIMMYSITEKEAEKLEPLLNIKFDFDKFIYDVGCYSE